MIKRLLFLVLFSFISFYGKAQIQNQDSIFLANTWRLQKLEINQNTISAPNNSELSFPKLEPYIFNNNYYFNVTQCGTGAGQAAFYFESNTKLTITYYATLVVFCYYSSNADFDNIYNNDFIWSNMTSSFDYVINFYNSHLELIIIGQNGNKAHYHNNLSASIHDIELKEKIKLSPNPVVDQVFISGDEQLLEGLNELLLYNLSGQLVFKGRITSSRNFDLSHLASGSYIVRFTNNEQFFNHGLIIKNKI